MVWFVKVSCPFLKVEYEETTSHPICRKDGIYLDKHQEKKEIGCQGCEILDLTPTDRILKYYKMFLGVFFVAILILWISNLLIPQMQKQKKLLIN